MPDPHETSCTWRDEENCAGCGLGEGLTCRWSAWGLVRFYLIFLPFALGALGTLIAYGYHLGGWWPLMAWGVFMLAFFGVVETRVLCCHCPFYARPGRILRCPVNYGVPRLWRYRPGPMKAWENAVLGLGLLLVGLFPVGAGAWGAAAVASREGRPGYAILAALTAGTTVALLFTAWLVHRLHCTRCVNLSCFLNRVPADAAEAYLERNPAMKRAFEEADRT